MQTNRLPYEFLVRWDHTGRLSGAHAQFRYVTTAPDGAVIAEAVGAAEPVAVAGAEGFPLADILSEAHAAALTSLAEVTAERDQLRVDLAALQGEYDRLRAQRDTLPV